jgi:3-(3-hydroxy-phenyl)propionate hydroxylase
MTSHDVLISGLGPTGAVLAGLLGQRGLRVAVFDKSEDLFPLPRAVGLDHEAMRIVQELGISEEMTKIIDHYRPSEYLGMDGQLIKRLDTEPPPYRLGWEPNYVFNQPKFETAIRARLHQIPGITVYKNSEVTSVRQTSNKVKIKVKRLADSTEETYSARYLIACDGGSSPIRKSMGIELEDLGFNEPWLVVDARVPQHVSEKLPQTQVQYCEAERPCTFVYCTDDHRRWEIMLNEDEYRTGDFPDEMLWPILQRWIQPGEVKFWRRAAYRFHGLIARQWRSSNVFLAGDAAHMTPPFMAQGMVQGLRDAHNLAWKLAHVIEGKAHTDLLDTYELERLPHVRSTTLKAIELGRVICERDPEKARVRDQKLREEQGGTVQTAYRQQMIPGLTTGLIQTNNLSAGKVFPQPFIEIEGSACMLDDKVGSDYVFYYDATNESLDLSQLKNAAGPLSIHFVAITKNGPSDLKKVFSVNAPMIADWMRTHSASTVLVRPDKYVYGCADTLESSIALINALRRRVICP